MVEDSGGGGVGGDAGGVGRVGAPFLLPTAALSSEPWTAVRQARRMRLRHGLLLLVGARMHDLLCARFKITFAVS